MNHREMKNYTDEYYIREGISWERMDFNHALGTIYPFLNWTNRFPENDETERQSVLYAFDKLNDISNDLSKTFVYTHILCPHRPYLFDEDGKLPDHSIVVSDNSTAYLEQYKYINKLILNTVDNILKNDKNSVIIVQSDHGWRVTPETSYEILNAYYFPDGYQLYETISPVNSFREIFNHCFGTNYEILKDEKVKK